MWCHSPRGLCQPGVWRYDHNDHQHYGTSIDQHINQYHDNQTTTTTTSVPRTTGAADSDTTGFLTGWFCCRTGPLDGPGWGGARWDADHRPITNAGTSLSGVRWYQRWTGSDSGVGPGC
jgi:hypothetical protein